VPKILLVVSGKECVGELKTNIGGGAKIYGRKTIMLHAQVLAAVPRQDRHVSNKLLLFTLSGRNHKANLLPQEH